MNMSTFLMSVCVDFVLFIIFLAQKFLKYNISDTTGVDVLLKMSKQKEWTKQDEKKYT